MTFKTVNSPIEEVTRNSVKFHTPEKKSALKVIVKSTKLPQHHEIGACD